MEEINATAFTAGSFPFRYLGLPLMHRKLRKSEYSPLIDSLTSRFTHWTTRSLSFAGRLQLISSVIYSTVNFWFGVFSIPKYCIIIIERLCSRFLWTGDISKKGGIKVSWSQVCLPKEEGGLGLRDFKIWNKVLSLKLIWILFSKSGSLWVAWSKAHTLKGKSFWDFDPTNSISWMWKRLVKLRPLAKQFITCSVGNGASAHFWFDHWLHSGPLIEFIGETGPRIAGLPRDSLVKDAYTHMGWILPSARTRNQNLKNLRLALMLVAAPTGANGDDTFEWKAGGDGTGFSATDTWEILRQKEDSKSWHKVVWFKGNVPKHAFTFWVAQLDRLPLHARMNAWDSTISPLCSICLADIEDRDHLFLQCSYAKQVWKYTLHRLGQDDVLLNTWEDLVKWLANQHILPQLVSQLTVYSLWKERNQSHGGTKNDPAQLFATMDRGVKDIILSRIKRNSFSNMLTKWFTHS